MTTRLQVLFEDAELEDIRRFASEQRMTVAEWVRQALRQARRASVPDRGQRKLSAVREGYAGSYPTADIEQMLAEIESGYNAPLPE
ncbi:MAG: antitoxin [Phycisphaerae bacterium]|nr:antitoxin [Gemmatimonadaceae bacterium]